MQKIKTRFARVDARNQCIGILSDKNHINEQWQKWHREDSERMLALCEEMGIPVYGGMWYELALKLARELYPEKKKAGRPLKWGDMELAILATEVACQMLHAGKDDWKVGRPCRIQPILGQYPGSFLGIESFHVRGGENSIFHDTCDNNSNHCASF